MADKAYHEMTIFEQREARAKEWETNPARVYLADIPLDQAIRAYNGTSHWPEVRGEDARRDYASYVYEIKQFIDDKALDADLGREVFMNFRNRYQSLYLAWLNSHSRLASTFVVGGSNFPARRMEKLNRWTDNHYQRLMDFQMNTKRVVMKKLGLSLSNAISSDDPEATDKLQGKLAALEANQAMMKTVNQAYRSCGRPDPSDHKRWAEVAEKAGVQLESLMDARKRMTVGGWTHQPFPAFALSNNNANIKRVRGRIKELEYMATRETEAQEFDGFELVENAEANRIQFIFDGKPPAETRALLKRNGFRWAPSQGAWQRQLNANGRYAAQHVAKVLKEG